MTFPAMAEVQLLDSAEAKYISRGGLKLEGALAATGLSVAGLRCLDVGQSTGGFTDCLLQHGAAQVIGVDVGHGQLHERLRHDPRVVGVRRPERRATHRRGAAGSLRSSPVRSRSRPKKTTTPSPRRPTAWMRNGGLVDEDYDDSDDAKEHDIEAFKAERAAKAKARAAGTVPVLRQRRAGREDVDITPQFDADHGRSVVHLAHAGAARPGAAAGAAGPAADAGQAAV